MEVFYKGLRFTVPESVYQPAEDSFMLADAAYQSGEVLEMGCGCGIVSLCWAKENKVLGADINPEAVRAAKENAQANGLQATFILSDLFSDIGGRFDVILFNPPYLPTSDDERLEGDINRAFDGGADGRAVLDRFLDGFEKHLKPDGTLFLVQSSLNGLDQTISVLEDKGFRAEAVEKYGFFFEKLCLLRARKV